MVTVFNTLELIETNQTIYYQDAPTSTAALVNVMGDFLHWNGTIPSVPNSYGEVLVEGDLYLGLPVDHPYLANGFSGDVLGVLLYSYSKYKLTVPDPDGIYYW